MDVHKEAISVAVMNSSGRVVMESILETKASTLVQFVQGLRGDLQVTFEEGTWAAWLYDTDRQGPGRLLAEKINRSLRQRSWNNLFPFPINRLCGHFERHASIEKVDLPSWCFTLPDSEYQACSPAHVSGSAY